MTLPDRGSLVWLHFSPQAGREQADGRPGIDLTTAAYHRRSRLASGFRRSREKGLPTEVKLPDGLPVAGSSWSTTSEASTAMPAEWK